MSSLVIARLPSSLGVVGLRLLTMSSASELTSPPAFHNLTTGLHLLQLLAIVGYQLFLMPSLYSLGTDRIENTASNSYSIVTRLSVAAIRVY
jgi:hypothetical protein